MDNHYLSARLVTRFLLFIGFVIAVSFDDFRMVLVGAALLLTAALILTLWPELSEE